MYTTAAMGVVSRAGSAALSGSAVVEHIKREKHQ